MGFVFGGADWGDPPIKVTAAEGKTERHYRLQGRDMSPPRTEQRLAEIADRMALLAGETDIEMAHGDADHLLLDALRALMEWSCNEDERASVERIIAAWADVEKWYA